jgi:hypothetical protein
MKRGCPCAQQFARTPAASIVANPFPILTQIVTNQIANANTLFTGLQQGFTDFLQSLPTTQANAQAAINQILGGDLADGFPNLVNSVLGFGGPILVPLVVGVLEPLFTTTQQTATNLATVATVPITGIALVGLFAGDVVNSLASAFGSAAQDVVNAVSAGDLAGTVTALLNGPAVIIDGLLNGFPAGNFGLLNGLYSVVQSLQQIITSDITPATSSASVASATVAALPSAGPMVAVSTTPAPQTVAATGTPKASTVAVNHVQPLGAALTGGPDTGGGPGQRWLCGQGEQSAQVDGDEYQ